MWIERQITAPQAKIIARETMRNSLTARLDEWLINPAEPAIIQPERDAAVPEI